MFNMKTENISLNGIWTLSGRREKCNAAPCASFDECDFSFKDAAVPGNIELELEKNGFVPEIQMGRNAEKLRPYEFYEFLFEKDFEYSGDLQDPALVFEGVDCLAVYYLNGVKIGESENAFISHRFEVRDTLKKGMNHLSVHIASAVNRGSKLNMPVAPSTPFIFNSETIDFRKPAHSWGWDISLRAALGGIWRNVRLEETPVNAIEELFIDCSCADEESASLYIYSRIKTNAFEKYDRLYLKIKGVCQEHSWETKLTLWSYHHRHPYTLKNPKLWMPRNYGEPNLYEITAELVTADGEVLANKKFNLGVRRIELKFNDIATDSKKPEFQFFVNSVPVRLFGTNHVPASYLHSQDLSQYPLIAEALTDMNCNMVRIWGGGVYEAEEFYDACDRNGVLVWHDFMLACAVYRQEEYFEKALAEEAAQIIKQLRQHPSIALWCGDNECDLTPAWMGIRTDPNLNTLTRKVLAKAVADYDFRRPYIASSPYISTSAFNKAAAEGKDRMSLSPEQHLWYQETDYKEACYTDVKASFLSEFGRIGCPSAETLKTFIPQDSLYPVDNEMWKFHACAPFLSESNAFLERFRALIVGIDRYFGAIPDNLQDFVAASQIHQAEAMKFLFENYRIRKKMTGLLWWNLKDAAPALSDAAIDFCGRKKLIYCYLKNSQQALLGVMTENDGKIKFTFCNDSLKDAEINFKVRNGLTNEILFDGKCKVKANDVSDILNENGSELPSLLLLEWQDQNGRKGVNHLFRDVRPVSLEDFKTKVIPVLCAIYGAPDDVFKMS